MVLSFLNVFLGKGERRRKKNRRRASFLVKSRRKSVDNSSFMANYKKKREYNKVLEILSSEIDTATTCLIYITNVF